VNILYIVEDDATHVQIKESEWRNYFGKCVIHVKYRCFHCGDLKNNGGVIVHKETCKIGADERLNAALWMVSNLNNHIIANEVATPRVTESILEFEAQYK